MSDVRELLRIRARKALIPSIIGVGIATLVMLVNTFLLFLILRNQGLKSKVQKYLFHLSLPMLYLEIQHMGFLLGRFWYILSHSCYSCESSNCDHLSVRCTTALLLVDFCFHFILLSTFWDEFGSSIRYHKTFFRGETWE